MKLTLLSTSDVHGYIAPTNYGKRQQDLDFGLAKAATLIKQEKENGPTLCVETGDFIQGSPLSYYIAKNKHHSVAEIMDVANSIGYDAGIIGNHEFNYGKKYLQQAIQAANYPILAANIIDEATGKPAFGNAYHLFQFDDLTVALLGVTTAYIPHWEKPAHIQGLQFKPIVETVKEYLPLLKEQADLVVVAYHGGFERDLETGEPTEALTGENEGYQLLEEVEGIDAFITGHQHRTIATKVNGVPVVQPGYRGQNVGKIELNIEKIDGRYQVTHSTESLLDVSQVTPDKEVMQLIEKVNDEVEDWLDQPLGEVVSGSMRIDQPNEARLVEHPYIEFINRVQMEATGADISGTALFNNEGKGFDQQITMRDIVTNYIYPNTLAVEKVTGTELKQALEQSVSFFILEDGKVAINPAFVEPKPQYYNYDMYEGIDYVVDLHQPIGQRIVSLKYHGKDIQPDDELEIVINQYRAVGGGNYAMFSADKIVREVQIDMTELIADYLVQHPQIKAETNQNFTIKY